MKGHINIGGWSCIEPPVVHEHGVLGMSHYGDGFVSSLPHRVTMATIVPSQRPHPLLYCGPGLNEVSAFLEYERSLLIPITMLYHIKGEKNLLMLSLFLAGSLFVVGLFQF